MTMTLPPGAPEAPGAADPAALPSPGAGALRPPRGQRLLRWWTALAGVVLALYLFFDRGVAHVHLPGTTAYIGELTLLAGLVAASFGPAWVRAALRRDSLMAVLVAFMLWGALRAAADLGRFGVVDVVHDSALWYYGLFAVLVVTAAGAVPEWPARLVRGFSRLVPWLSVWLPVTFLLSKLGVRIGPVPLLDDAPLLDHKGGNVAVVAAILLAYLLLVPDPRRTRRSLVVLGTLNAATIVLATTQTRGGGLAALTAVVVALGFAGARRRGRVVVPALGVLVVVVALAAATGFSLSTHKRAISVDEVVTEVQTALRLGAAPGAANGAAKLVATENFRLNLWANILHQEVAGGRLLTGFGFGPNLATVGGAKESKPSSSVDQLRSAHNSHLDVLARMGLIGAGLWAVLWLGWFRRLLRARRRYAWAQNQADRAVVELLVVAVLAILVDAVFDPTFESAQVGAVAFTLFGLGVVWSARPVLGAGGAALGRAGVVGAPRRPTVVALTDGGGPGAAGAVGAPAPGDDTPR